MIKKKVEEYNKNGFTLCNLFQKKEYDLINQFALDWFYNLCKINKNDISNFPIEKYHLWYKKKILITQFCVQLKIDTCIPAIKFII